MFFFPIELSMVMNSVDFDIDSISCFALPDRNLLVRFCNLSLVTIH